MLFGSDYPLISPKRYFDEMKASGLTDAQFGRFREAMQPGFSGLAKDF